MVGGTVYAHTRMFSGSDMDFVLGTARFVGERTVEIKPHDSASRQVRGRDVVIQHRYRTRCR